MKEPFLQKLRRAISRFRALLACWVYGPTSSGQRHYCNQFGWCERCHRVIKGRRTAL